MSNFTLDSWRIKDFAPGEGLAAGASAGSGEGWIAAQAPGDTYLALIAARRLEHPYRARNETAAAWVRDREWWWHTTAELCENDPAVRLELLFEGLDTFADVYLDGHLLGHANNMFREWRFDLPEIVDGHCHLAICFHPTAAMTGDRPLPVWNAFTDRISRSRRTAMRKAQFGWGWDWGPDLPTVGIWKPAAIVFRPVSEVRSANFTTLSLSRDVAEVRVDLDLSAFATAEVELKAPDGSLAASGTRNGSGSIDFAIAKPQLWWTADLGAQPLYTLVARMPGASDFVRRVGIRTIAIDQSPDPDEPGTTFFRFVLNGVPIFAKGANWVPADSFVGGIPNAKYADLLQRSVAANMNMIRVWGGGIYEPDVFYDECDRLGLLVWQDFMFACGPYPEDDPAFVENVRREVQEQVMRLRHHACLALWCGNNENQAIHWFNDVAEDRPSTLEGAKFYDEVIPAALAALDPATPYWPGSPLGGPSPNSMRAGDVHNWTVWHGIPLVPDADPVGDYESTPEGVAFSRFAEDRARFVSELGLQGAPDEGTLARWMAPEDIGLGRDGFLERIKDLADKASWMMSPVTGLPRDIGEFVDFSQLAQAEGLAFGIEHYRRRKPHCSGALIWQLNDCWPCVSWSLIDYDGVAKPSFYSVARAFAPVMASFKLDGDAAELWIVNDTLEPVRGRAIVAITKLQGGEEWRENMAFQVPANASAMAWRGLVCEAPDRLLTVRSSSFLANRRLLSPIKDMHLSADPGLAVVYQPDGDILALSISATQYALGVMLRSVVPGMRFTDNFFDLAPGETRTIRIANKDGEPVRDDEIEVTCFNGKARG